MAFDGRVGGKDDEAVSVVFVGGGEDSVEPPGNLAAVFEGEDGVVVVASEDFFGVTEGFDVVAGADGEFGGGEHKIFAGFVDRPVEDVFLGEEVGEEEVAAFFFGKKLGIVGVLINPMGDLGGGGITVVGLVVGGLDSVVVPEPGGAGDEDCAKGGEDEEEEAMVAFEEMFEVGEEGPETDGGGELPEGSGDGGALEVGKIVDGEG